MVPPIWFHQFAISTRRRHLRISSLRFCSMVRLSEVSAGVKKAYSRFRSASGPSISFRRLVATALQKEPAPRGGVDDPTLGRQSSQNSAYQHAAWKGMAHGSITCHLACHHFIAGFRVQYGNSGAGLYRRAFSLRRKRTSPRPSPRASKCRAGLASHPGKVTWGKVCRQYVPGQQSDSLPTRPWQQGLALFRPRWSVPYRLKAGTRRLPR